MYMNLLRPIKMSLAARPPTLYDLRSGRSAAHSSQLDANADGDADADEDEGDVLAPDEGDVLSSFYLPRGTTKLLYINR